LGRYHKGKGQERSKQMVKEIIIETDVLVIGGGMAGNFAAIKASSQGASVTLVDKGYAGRSGATHYAGGDFAVFNPAWGHNLDAWMDQINKRCEYLNNRLWGEIVLKESYPRYQDLISWGIKLYEENGKIWIGRSGVTEYFNLSYRKYAPLLRKKSLESGVKIIDRMMVSELLKQDGKIVGAIGFHTTSGELYIFKAGATVIAAGGGSLKEGNRPIHYWTADGEAMAFRAGAEISGKEFKFGGGGSPRSASSKKVSFIKVVTPDEGSDKLARFPAYRGGTMGPMVMPTLNSEGGPVTSATWEAHFGRAPLWIDLDAYTPEQIADFQSHFRRLGTHEADKIGLNIFKGGKLKFSPGSIETAQPIHAGGAGIWPVDTNCTTSLPGLYAAGDSCATMVSGAQYAGMGFGLCHASVTGAQAGLSAAGYAAKSKKIVLDELEIKKTRDIVTAPIQRRGGFSPAWTTQVVQNLTVPYFIFHVKSGERLQAALTLVEFINSHIVPLLKANSPHEWRMAQETKNMALHAEMMLRASIFRTESRGTHYREDYPRRDDPAWLAWVKIKEHDGRMELVKEPVPEAWWPDLSQPYEARYPLMFPGE
jgi:succinate dehydrogenase/fumarate reductase flavoprotein subunit